MKDQHEHHGELLKGFFREQQQVFDGTSQSMYAFLDDGCVVCNVKFAQLLGYANPDDWAAANSGETFTEVYVDSQSQRTLVDAYQKAMEKMEGSTIAVTWKKKSGGTVRTSVILVPVMYEDHLFALHFISG